MLVLSLVLDYDLSYVKLIGNSAPCPTMVNAVHELLQTLI